MTRCIICFLRGSHHPRLQIHPEEQHPFHSDLARELEDSRKFSLNSLTVLLAILAVSGSKVLQPVVLTLLIYTISLRLAINTCFLHNFPTWSRCLHVVPLLGTYCSAGVALVSGVQSPVLATVSLVLGVFPFMAMFVHRGTCGDTSAAALPVRIQDMPVSAVGGVPDTHLG